MKPVPDPETRLFREIPAAGEPSPVGLEQAFIELIRSLDVIGQAELASASGHQEATDRVFAGASRYVQAAWALAPDELAARLPDLAPTLSTGTFALAAWGTLSLRVQAALAQYRAEVKPRPGAD